MLIKSISKGLEERTRFTAFGLCLPMKTDKQAKVSFGGGGGDPNSVHPLVLSCILKLQLLHFDKLRRFTSQDFQSARHSQDKLTSQHFQSKSF